MISHLSKELKLELIERLVQSLKETEAPEQTTSRLEKAFGGWGSDESAEEIIDMLQASRHTNRQIDEF